MKKPTELEKLQKRVDKIELKHKQEMCKHERLFIGYLAQTGFVADVFCKICEKEIPANAFYRHGRKLYKQLMRALK